MKERHSITITKNDEETNKALLLLNDWKSQYLAIDCLIQDLNSTFGFTLLVIISTTFVRLIYNTFMALTPMTVGTSWIEYMYIYFTMVQDIFILVLISFVCHRMESKVH